MCGYKTYRPHEPQCTAFNLIVFWLWYSEFQLMQLSTHRRRLQDTISWLALLKCSPGFPWVNICNWSTQDLDTLLCFMSVFFDLDKNSRNLWGFRDCSCWDEFSHMKEQLDEMNIPSRPGCCFWYSYRHTTGRRLNKHYSMVENMTLRSNSSAAVTPPNHKSVHYWLCVLSF